MNDLRLEFRAKNNVLWHAIFDQHRSIADFCRTYDISQAVVGELLRLQRSPYHKDGDRSLTPAALKLCAATGLGRNELFPPELYSGLFPGKGVAEVESSRFVALAAARTVALPPAQEDAVISNELGIALEEVLKTLTPREEKVLRLRFGLGGDDEATLDSVGRSLGVGKQRARQIEAKALRKLRYLSRARRLRPFLPDVTAVAK